MVKWWMPKVAAGVALMLTSADGSGLFAAIKKIRSRKPKEGTAAAKPQLAKPDDAGAQIGITEDEILGANAAAQPRAVSTHFDAGAQVITTKAQVHHGAKKGDDASLKDIYEAKGEEQDVEGAERWNRDWEKWAREMAAKASEDKKRTEAARPRTEIQKLQDQMFDIMAEQEKREEAFDKYVRVQHAAYERFLLRWAESPEAERLNDRDAIIEKHKKDIKQRRADLDKAEAETTERVRKIQADLKAIGAQI